MLFLFFFTSALKVLSSSAPRAPSAHSHSARRVRLQSNQRQLSREVEAIMVGGVIRRYMFFCEFSLVILLLYEVKGQMKTCNKSS